MTYILAGVIIIAAVRMWLMAIVKKAVVQPVMRDGKLIGPLLSEKPRWKLIKEEYGFIIGAWLGIILTGVVCWVLLP
jgi:hypothetical protein